MYSLQKRFFIGTIASILFFALLLNFALDQSFKKKLKLAEFKKSQGLIYTLLASVEVNENREVWVDSSKSEQLLSDSIKAAVFNSDHKLLWSNFTDDVLFKSAVKELKPFQLDQWSFAKTQVSFFSNAYNVSWSISEAEEIKLTFVILTSAKNYQKERKVHQNKTFVWLFLGGLTLLFMQLVFLRKGFEPLHKITQQVNEIQKGDRLKIEERVPEELDQLIEGINSLSEHHHQQNEKFGQAIDNLAHALKTPLSGLKNMISEEKSQSKKEMLNQVKRIEESIEYQSKKVHFVNDKFFAQEVSLNKVIERTLSFLNKAYADKNVHIQNQLNEGLCAKITEGDAMELFGNILENSYKWCEATVEIKAYKEQNQLVVSVVDDGPGFQTSNPMELLQRGKRLDEAKPGSGFGLSIANQIAQEFGGSIKLYSPASSGGARVDVFLVQATSLNL